LERLSATAHGFVEPHDAGRARHLRNVEQAIALFKRVPVWFPDELVHFFVADASGDFAVIEWGKDRQLSVTRQKGGVLVSLNTSLMEGRESLMKDWRRDCHPCLDGGAGGRQQTG
jgi:hypothetical protein